MKLATLLSFRVAETQQGTRPCGSGWALGMVVPHAPCRDFHTSLRRAQWRPSSNLRAEKAGEKDQILGGGRRVGEDVKPIKKPFYICCCKTL